jgi:predicted DCC family thiol-disulfide oxidoreductase YuxK
MLTAALTMLTLIALGVKTQDPYGLALGAVLVARVAPARGLMLGAAPLFPLTWVLLAAACIASGVWHLREDAVTFAFFEFACVPFALVRTLRPWLWGAMLLAQAGWALAGRGLPPASAPLLLLAFAFDPVWIRARTPAAPHVIFYDGGCGFCHASVRFLLREDVDGRAFRFAPLQGTLFTRSVGEAERARLPDSIVLRTADGRLCLRSDALLEMGAALGGLWRPLAALAGLVPRALRDAVYDRVARVRGRFFSKPAGLCPLLPPQWMKRFDAE